ncbi:MAG: alpha/beta fold hydrolase [Bacteroidota bacterium]
MRPSKKILRISIFIAILFFVAVFLAHYFFPQMILQPRRTTPRYTLQQYGLQGAKMVVESKDSLELSAYYIGGNQKPKATILLLHGIGSCKEHMLNLSKYLLEKGYASIAIDLRAHGRSEGEYCTYGYYEKQDISQIVSDYLRYHPDAKIGIWGNSLGGAIALQSMAYDERIEFGIIQSTFTDMTQIVSDYQKRYFGGLRLKWLSHYALNRAGKIANFNPKEVSPLNDVEQINRPVLILHGTDDQRISFEYGKQLYEGLASKEKRFVAMEGAGHNNISAVNDSLYFGSVEAFLRDQVD